MTTGRSASARSVSTRSTPSATGSSSGLRTLPSIPGSSPSMKTRSIGKSRNVGPQCGAIAVAIASSTRPGISSVVSGVAANFVSGRANGTWSISCSEPWPQRIAGARPPSTIIGEPPCSAEPIALIPFVTPGPAVSAATPGCRVTLDHPSAAKAAADSWRTSTMSIPSSRHPSKIEKRCPPLSVNSFVTPCALRRRAISLPPWTLVACSVSVPMPERYRSGARRRAARGPAGAPRRGSSRTRCEWVHHRSTGEQTPCDLPHFWVSSALRPTPTSHLP